MLTARPEVKRTYSRLKKDTDTTTENGNVNVNVRNENCEIKSADVSMTIESEMELGIVKVDKMRKITDFFKVKRDESSITSSPKTTGVNNDFTNSVLSSPVTSVSNKLKQTYLDLGQKDLVSSQCPDCFMHYNKSFPDDVNLHKKLHASYLKGYNFNVKIDGETVVEMAPKDLLKWSKFRFYEIKRFEAKLLKKMEFFLNFVNVQLGAEPLTAEELQANKKFDAIVAVEQAISKILGFALFEKCSKVFKSLTNCDNCAIELEAEAVEGRENGFIGVSRIWVEERHRSMGLARMMLDLRCKEARGSVAFSQPTPAGFAFAKSYQKEQFKGGQCLIYLK